MQELCEATFVPNSCHVVGGCGTQEDDVSEDDANAEASSGRDPDAGEATKPKHSMIVCTGPNACGKVRAVRRFLGDRGLTIHPECLLEAERTHTLDGPG